MSQCLILIRHRKLYRLRHTYDTGDILRTGTTLSLLRSAVDKGTDLYTLADIEETDALRAVELVAAGAEHIDIHFIHIDLQMSQMPEPRPYGTESRVLSRSRRSRG